ncbi:unnamed protein product [Urochloa decumbens]|uniref:TF-B3 domain-containing protein n=1 Tax=Urochloa decumbens TaxID=240449 RepID=A0ABC8VND8_9POAL
MVHLQSWLRGGLKDDERLIPFAPFCHQVREIADSFSSEKLRWTPEALLELQDKAEDYLSQVLGAVIRLVRGVMKHPIPWYGNNTRLTQEQKEAVFVLSCGTSGVPVYVHTMTECDFTGAPLALPVQYCQRFLAPRLGSEKGQIKLFYSNNLTCSEISFSTECRDFRLYTWSHYIKSNCVKEGDTYAFTFEEDEEGGLLSVRMHALNGMLGSEEYDKERPQRLQGSEEGTLSMEQRVAVARTASICIPYSPFVRMVLEITACCSSGISWSRDALLSLHEAAVKHLVSLYEVVNQFATLLTPYISDGTKLTPEEEQAAISLSYDCASGIRTYIWTIKGSNRELVFQKKFSEQYLSPYLGSGRWIAKVFAGNDLSPFEVSLHMTKPQRAALYGGWPHFMKINGFKKGDVCAYTFEEGEDEEGAPLSLRVHLLRAAPM